MSLSIDSSFLGDDFSNKFYKVKRLGKGSYGKVYLMKTKDDDQEYAVKRQCMIIYPRSSELEKSSLLDTDALVRLRSVPEVIELMGICYDSKYLYIIMEVMDCNLKDYCELSKPSIRLKCTRNLLLSLTRAATFFEHVNINHFDIKPQNILVKQTDPPRFVITDFGISHTVFSPHHASETVMFTLWYRPPEILMGRPLNTFNIFKSDIWAIALTVIEFINRDPVFSGLAEADILVEIFKAVCDSRETKDIIKDIIKFGKRNKKGTVKGNINVAKIIYLFDKLDPSITLVLSDMLALNPDDRPSGREVLDELNETVDPEIFELTKPPVYHRCISQPHFKIIMKTSDMIPVKWSTTIIALEIITRYLGFVKNAPNIAALAALYIANKFNQACILDSWIFKQAYNRIVSSLKNTEEITNTDLRNAEKDILKTLKFSIYHTELSPALQRFLSYSSKLKISDVNMEEYMKPVSEWFKNMEKLYPNI